MRIKKAVVTGASGFIGRYLVSELCRQKIKIIEVVRCDTSNYVTNNDTTRVICNLSDYKSLPQKIPDRDIDVIFHMAWQGVSDEDSVDIDVQMKNIKATCDLVDSAYKMGIKTFVGAGSMYEPEAIIENNNQKPITNLKMISKSSKTAAHWMAKAKAGNNGMRFFWPYINTYGEGEYSGRLLSTMIAKMVNGQSPELSDGFQYYDFLHIEDVARALILIAEKGIDGKNYVLSSGKAKPLKDYLEEAGKIVNEITRQNVPLGLGKIQSNVVYIPKDFFYSEDLFIDTGFRPQITFEEGIRRTVSYYLEHSDGKRE